MSQSVEDIGANCLVKLFFIGLVVSGISWLIQWICRKIADNAEPLIAIAVIAVVVAIIVVVVKHNNAEKAAVAKWEQDELVPLLSSLNAMEKLNRSESFASSLPRELEIAEGRIPVLERRLAEAESRANSLSSGQA